jgi:hypothetical protein
MNDRWQFDQTLAGLQSALHVTHVATSPLLNADAREPVHVVRRGREPRASTSRRRQPFCKNELK